MPPASSRGLRSDAPSSRQIIVQSPAIFKSLHLSRSALGSHVAEHFHLRDIRTVKPHAGCLFLAGLRTAGDLLQSSVFAISLHPVFAHVVFAQDLPGLLKGAC
jgi:hypothetical protein